MSKPSIKTPQAKQAAPVPVVGGGYAYLAHNDTRRDERFRVRIANGNADGGTEYVNFPVIAGFMGDNADFSLSGSFANLSVTLPDVTSSLYIGLRLYAPTNQGSATSTAAGAYSQVQARFRDVNHVIEDIQIRTDNQDNILSNRLRFYSQRADLNFELVSKAMDEGYKSLDSGNIGTFTNVVKGVKERFLGASRALLIERIAANSYIELEFKFSHVGDVGFLAPRQQQVQP